MAFKVPLTTVIGLLSCTAPFFFMPVSFKLPLLVNNMAFSLLFFYYIFQINLILPARGKYPKRSGR